MFQIFLFLLFIMFYVLSSLFCVPLDLMTSDVVAGYSRKHSPLYAELEGRITFVEFDEDEVKDVEFDEDSIKDVKFDEDAIKDDKMACGVTALYSVCSVVTTVLLFATCVISSV